LINMSIPSIIYKLFPLIQVSPSQHKSCSSFQSTARNE
jgi:hypothetical protein